MASGVPTQPASHDDDAARPSVGASERHGLELDAEETSAAATRRERVASGWRRFRQPGVDGPLSSLRAEAVGELGCDASAFALLWKRAPIAMSRLDLAWLRAQRLLEKQDRE